MKRKNMTSRVVSTIVLILATIAMIVAYTNSTVT